MSWGRKPPTDKERIKKLEKTVERLSIFAVAVVFLAVVIIGEEIRQSFSSDSPYDTMTNEELTEEVHSINDTLKEMYYDLPSR